METDISYVLQPGVITPPSEDDLRAAVHAAVAQSGPELFKAFFNGYKDQCSLLAKAA